jgi:hypothetical protein
MAGSCWKCGKTLPDGQVECEYGCGDPPVDKRAGLNLVITIFPDASKTETAEQQKGFNVALAKFGRMLAAALAESGLKNFCKPPK